MSNNLDAPVLNVKLIKWSLNRINYYKTLYTNLHYFNVSVGQCERHPSHSIDYCKYQPFMDTLAIENQLACHFFVLFTHQININDLIYYYIYIYIYISLCL